MLKDILLPITGSGDDAAIQYALGLAETGNTHLVVLVIVQIPLPIASEFGAMPSAFYAELCDAARARGQPLAQTVRERLRLATCSWEVRTTEVLSPWGTRGAAAHARLADLSILAAPAAEDGGMARELFPELLMDSGRPVLVVPGQAPPAIAGRKAVLAWQPTTQAARAVHDALPLLRMAESVDVLMVDPVADPWAQREEAGADIAAHLARHSLRVNVVVVANDGGSAATRILQHVRETGAGLLVAGGYSHSRVREFVLGGTTRTLLFESPVPVLFAH